MFGCYTRNKVDNEMPNLTLENIANACEGTYVGDPSKKTENHYRCCDRQP